MQTLIWRAHPGVQGSKGWSQRENVTILGKQYMKSAVAILRRRRQQQQIQMQRIKGIAILKKDEFTEHKLIENILQDFALDAREAHAHFDTSMRALALTYALKIEEKLKEMGKPELISGICNELLDVLKQARVKWSEKYLRKCLPERYKDPTKRFAALQRKREGPAGMPPDSDLSEEELEARLTPGQEAARRVFGEYTLKHSMISKGKKPFKPIITHVTGDGIYTSILPIVIKVNAAEQTARAWVDEDEYDKIVTAHNEKTKVETKTNTNTKTETKKHLADADEAKLW